MAADFKDLTNSQQAAVTGYVNREFERVISENPTSYLAQNAQSDPEGWRKRLRELIAPDEKRVATIVRAEEMQGIRPSLGFTLIELSIVLVIIGLIVGGVLVGQDLIGAAAVRAQISQIEKYQTAVNTFRGKYNALPGDLNAATAAQFGFASRGMDLGTGDGNGILEGYLGCCEGNPRRGTWQNAGETTMFWVDLTTANGLNVNLIDGSFSAASSTGTVESIVASAVDDYLPQAKLGNGNYVIVFSMNGVNYYAVATLSPCPCFLWGATVTHPAMTVKQAYSIDKKIDDGQPQTGGVTAQYIIGSELQWAVGDPACVGTNCAGPAPGTPAPPTALSCSIMAIMRAAQRNIR